MTTEEDFLTLDDAFSFGLNEIIAAMWTFDQGMLRTDIVNSRLAKYPIDRVWHARHLASRFSAEMQITFCRAVHILDRLKQYSIENKAK